MNAIVTADYSVPESGQLQEVAPGVLWLRMPLPFELDHINLYLLDDLDGWVVVDCGLGNADTRAVWQNVIARFLQGRPIKKVILTHAHVDHIGAAGWLCHYTGAPLWITAGEQATAEEYAQLSGGSADIFSSQANHFLHRLGMDEQQTAGIMGIFTGISALVHPLPGSIYELKEGMSVEIGNVQWQVIVSEGHSDRKSTRLNSSHITISYAVFCLKKKKLRNNKRRDENTQLLKNKTSDEGDITSRKQ